MEKELNLIEILKGAPMGTKLYSPLFGECDLHEVRDDEIQVESDMGYFTFHKRGNIYSNRGECLLFPARDNRDWSTFKLEKEVIQVGDYIKEKDSDNVFKIKQHDGTFVVLERVLADLLERKMRADCLDRYVKVEKFDPKWLKPFDRVLVRDNTTDLWFASLFSYSINEDEEEYPYTMCDGNPYNYCIPFNEETKSLVGTSNEEPEFYRI